MSYRGSAAVARADPGPWRPADLITEESNRWSSEGQRTIYLSRDTSVAVAEFARHQRDSEAGAWLWTLHVDLERTVDLRRPQHAASFGLPADPTWILDRSRCQQVAAEFRTTTSAIIVPSVAFLDQVDRWNLVVFPEGLGDRLSDAVQPGALVGRLQLGQL